MQILNEIQVSYQRKKDMAQVKTSEDAYNYFKPLFEKDCDLKEKCVLLLLNRSGKIIGHYELSTGGIDGTVIDVKIVMAIALKCLASGIVLAHNHPSGNLNPSVSDEKITQQIKQAAKFFEIQLMDHLIITSDNYYSLEDNGKL